jgi:hypothetical protein
LVCQNGKNIRFCKTAAPAQDPAKWFESGYGTA